VGRFAGVFGIVGNVVLCAIKLFLGLITASVSVIADSVNNLSDALSSVITIVSFKLSGKPADKDHPYGHERIEYITTLILAFLILFIGYELIKSSAGRILNPVVIPLKTISVVILCVSVIGKFVMSRVFGICAKAINSSMLKASAQDSLNDVFSTSAVLVSTVIGGVFDIGLDGYVGAVVSIFIIWSGIGLIRETMDTLLGKPPEAEFVREIADRVMAYDGVIGIHDLIVHSYGPSKTFASVHAEVDARGDVLASHDIIDNIEREISAAMGIELVIHMDPIVTDDESVNEARSKIRAIVQDIDSCLSIHDFRMVPGNTHTNLIFDIVLPFEFKFTEKQLLELVQNEVWHRIGRDYFCVINFDNDYNSAI
jgi:cation diffusion facilitator family transporter